MTVGSLASQFDQREFLGRNFGQKPEYCQISHLPVCAAEMVLPVSDGHVRVESLIHREKQWLADQGMRRLPNGFKLKGLNLTDLREVYVILLMAYNLTPGQRDHIRQCVSLIGGDKVLEIIEDTNTN